MSGANEVFRRPKRRDSSKKTVRCGLGGTSESTSKKRKPSPSKKGKRKRGLHMGTQVSGKNGNPTVE